MKDPSDIYKVFIKQIVVILKQHGFKNKGSNVFYIKRDNNWRFIWFQKNRYNTRGDFSFTINLSTCSNAIRNFLNPEKADEFPSVSNDYQWSNRLGFLLPERDDKWWKITSYTKVE